MSKEVAQESIAGCSTYKELAEKLQVSPATAKRLVTKYDLELDKEVLILPAVEDISKVMLYKPKISVNELAGNLGVETTALEKVMKENNIKVYTLHKIHNYNSFDFTKWIAAHIQAGDSPVQLGELMGLSSAKARNIAERLYKICQELNYMEFPLIPCDKPSPTIEELGHAIIDASHKYSYPKRNPYNYSQIHLAKNFLKVKICRKYQISDTTLEYLLNKYNLNDIYDEYAFVK